MFTWEREPYLTFRGLVNVTMHVLGSFVARGKNLEVEQVDWIDDLPGIMKFRVAPQYWISRHEGLAGLAADERAVQVRERFEGLLQLVVAYATTGEKIKANLRDVLAVYEQLLPHSTKQERPAMLATHVLFNALLGRQAMPSAERVTKSYAGELERRAVEYVAVELLLDDSDSSWHLRGLPQDVRGICRASLLGDDRNAAFAARDQAAVRVGHDGH